eukprot:UN29305
MLIICIVKIYQPWGEPPSMMSNWTAGSLTTVGSVPEHLRPENWHKNKKKYEEYLYSWELDRKVCRRLLEESSIQSVDLEFLGETFRLVLCYGVTENQDFYYSLTVNFTNKIVGLNIVDFTLRTFDWKDQVLLSPRTIRQVKNPKSVELLVMNSLNLNWQAFNEAICNEGLCFHVEFYVEVQENITKRKKKIFYRIFLKPVYSVIID